MSYDLARLGWTPGRDEEMVPHADQGRTAARVAVQQRGAYVVYTKDGDRPAEVTGRLRHEAAGPAGLPAVGDWVAVADAPGADAATIHAVLRRETAFSRKAAGEASVEQVVAANVDVVLLVSAFGPELNARRIERYLAAGWESGAEPVLVLNKSDLADDLAGAVAEAEAVASGVPVHAVSAEEGAGIDELAAYAEDNRTVALLGSSGVGKSSLVNRLLGRERQEVAGLRGDGRGRHTTTYRELLPLPGGGLVLDTPGLRELALWDAEAGVDETFADVGELAAGCRFADCAHEAEPGCAVLAAVADGRLDEARLASYRKLQRELRHLELRTDRRAAAEESRRWRRLNRSFRKNAY